MDIGFIFLSALFYYIIINQHTYSEATDPEHFHIIKDQELVDKLARKYAKHSRWTTARKLQNSYKTHRLDFLISSSNTRISFLAVCVEAAVRTQPKTGVIIFVFRTQN